MSKIIWVFDFDGVLFDSTRECYWVASIAWSNYLKSTNIDQKWKYRADLSYNEFKMARPFVKGGGEYFICFAYQNKIQSLTQDVFDSYVLDHPNEINSFTEFFYRARDKQKSDDYQKWLDTHERFSIVFDRVASISRKSPLYILTLKDRASVKTLCGNYGFDIDEQKLIDRSQVSSKLDALRHIASFEESDPRNIFFFDDNIAHLTGPHAAGFSCFLCAWCSAQESTLAMSKSLGIPILMTETECIRILAK